MTRGLTLQILGSLTVLLLAGAALSMPPRPDLLHLLQREREHGEVRGLARLELAPEEVPRAPALPGSIKALVLLVDFDDVSADTIRHSREHFHDMLFDLESQYSMRNYYLWTSYGMLNITGEVFGWFQLPELHSYYANNERGMGPYPNNARKMVEDAVDAANSSVDFSRFDNDGPDGIPDSGDDDGVVDFLMVVHGGQGYEWTMSPEDIHSHAAAISARRVDGVDVMAYATEPEDGKVGTFAHELGHLLGLPDLYDVTSNTYGLGMCSLMSYGSWGGGDGSRPVGLDAWSKIKIGFVEPVVVDTNIVGYELPCIEDEPRILRLWSEAEAGPQYFLVENREAQSWDSYLSTFGEGMLVYHVDERYKDNSSDAGHLVSLEQADGRFDLEERRLFGFGSDDGDPYPGTTGNRTFAWWTTPDNYSNEGNPTQVVLENISNAAETMTLDIRVWSPVIQVEDYEVDDEAGDGDGRPEPGEDLLLGVRLRNQGIECRNLDILLRTDDPHITPHESQASLTSLAKGGLSGYMSFPVSIGEDILEPYEIEFDIVIEGDHDLGGYSGSDRFILAVPLRRLDGWPAFAGDAITTPLAVADLDDDGFKEVIAGCKDGFVYVWEHDGRPRDGWPARVGSAVPGKPAVCDVDLDGSPEVVTCGSDGSVHVFNNDGSVSSGWPQHTGGELLSGALLADIDDDGMVEIICGARDGKVYAWDEDGSGVNGWPVELRESEIWMPGCAADIDGDHLAEIVIGGYGGQLYVIDGDGSYLDGWPVPVGRGCGRGAPAVADFDGDGFPEIAVSGLWSNSIYLVGVDGKIRYGWPKWSYNCDELSSPVAADIDNDRLPEIAVSTTCGTIAAWNADGTVCNVIKAVAPGPVLHCEPVFVDLDGNGSIEGLIGTSSGAESELYAFGGEGQIIGFPIAMNSEVWSTPVLNDIDNSGNAEIVVASTAGEVHVWRFVGAKETGRIEYSQSRGDIWNTGDYGFTPRANRPLPDLALSASDLVIEPVKPKEGEEISISVRVSNTGHSRADSFSVGVYHDDFDDSSIISSIEVPGLDAKRETTLVSSWPVPGGEPTRLILVRLDEADDVLERFELNNQAAQRFYLSLSDIEVAIDRVDPFPVTLGDSVTIYATVRNEGDDVARDFAIAFYDSIVEEPRWFAGIPIDSLVPGESLVLTTRHRIDVFWNDFVRLWAVADPQGRVLEYYLSNNSCYFDVHSGIEGELITTPYPISVRDVKSSRTTFVVESPACNCLFASSAEAPYSILFETPGGDIDISRNTIVFASGGDIAAFDLKDSLLFVVSTDEEYESQPAVWGDNMAWISVGDESTSVRFRGPSGSVESVHGLTAGTIRNLDMSDDMIVWEEDTGDGSDVMGYDLESGSAVAVCSEDGDQVNPSVWGKTVVWEDRSGDGGDIRGLDLELDRELAIAAGAGLQGNPVVYGDQVVWQDSRNGNWDIYGFSLNANEEFPISRQAKDQVLPSLSDSTVFWVDQRDRPDLVRGLRFGGNRTVASVRVFEALWQDGQIEIVADVDEHDDGITYRIYRYPDDRPMPEDRVLHVRHEFELGVDSTYVYADTLVAAYRPFFYTLGIIDGYGEEMFRGPVEGQAYNPTPRRFVIGVPYPNPFRYSVDLGFGLPRKLERAPGESWPDPVAETSRVQMAVYSVTGRLVRTIAWGDLVPGYYRLSWDGRDDRGEPVSSGVYFMTAATDGFVTSRKIVLVR
jgi:immune inhibitor A